MSFCLGENVRNERSRTLKDLKWAVRAFGEVKEGVVVVVGFSPVCRLGN